MVAARPQQKAFLDDRFATASQRTNAHSLKSGSDQRKSSNREKSKEFYNTNTRVLGNLGVGDHIFIQDQDSSRWSTPGKVTGIGPNNDYLVCTANGKEFRHNRRHLLKRTPLMPVRPDPALTYAEAAGRQRRTSSEPSTSTTRSSEPKRANHTTTGRATQREPDTITPVRRRNRKCGPQNVQPTRKQPERNRRPVYDVNNPISVWRK